MRRFCLILLAFAAACGGDSTGPKVDNSFIGIFALRSINGQSLPYVIAQQGASAATLTDDKLNISDGGSWIEVSTYSVTTNGTTTTQVGGGGGTWIRSGNQLALTNGTTNSTDYTGTFANGTLTMTGSGGAAFIFSR